MNLSTCPVCIEHSRHLPLSRRKINRLPCPVHGDFEIMPENVLPLKLSQLRLFKWQRAQANLNEYELVPDFPAIKAAIEIYSDANMTEICDKLLMVDRKIAKHKKK